MFYEVYGIILWKSFGKKEKNVLVFFIVNLFYQSVDDLFSQVSASNTHSSYKVRI